MGFLLTVVVTAAHVQEREGAHHRLEVLRYRLSRLWLMWADQAYTGDLAAGVWALRPWCTVRLDVVTRLKGLQGFHVLPKRWIVERTLAWLNRYRRLSKDDEYLTQISDTMIRVAMIQLMIRRLARTVPY